MIKATPVRDLEDRDAVAEAVGVGAIVFHYLSNSRVKDINFVIDDVLSFEGNTGPYILYTMVRIKSILAKYFADGTEKKQVAINASVREYGADELALMLL